MDSLREYDAGSSRSIPRLKDQWESRRQAEMYPPPDGGYTGGAGGPSPSRDRYSGGGGGGGGSRYEPYPRRGPSASSGGSDPYGGPSHGGPPMHAGDAISPSPMVVMPGGMQAPNIPGQMPTVLIQQADGTLVQAQVVTQAGGQYAVQPATSTQGAVQVLKSGYGISQSLSMPTNAGAGAQAASLAPQQAMPGAPHGQVLVQGPNGMMYAAAPAGPGASVAPGGPSNGPDRGGVPQGAPQYGVAPPASQYQVQQAAPHVGGGGQHVADPMAYNKLAGYGQQGVAFSPTHAVSSCLRLPSRICTGHVPCLCAAALPVSLQLQGRRPCDSLARSLGCGCRNRKGATRRTLQQPSTAAAAATTTPAAAADVCSARSGLRPQRRLWRSFDGRWSVSVPAAIFGALWCPVQINGLRRDHSDGAPRGYAPGISRGWAMPTSPQTSALQIRQAHGPCRTVVTGYTGRRNALTHYFALQWNAHRPPSLQHVWSFITCHPQLHMPCKVAPLNCVLHRCGPGLTATGLCCVQPDCAGRDVPLLSVLNIETVHFSDHYLTDHMLQDCRLFLASSMILRFLAMA